MARKKRSKKNFLLQVLAVQEIYTKHKYVNGRDSGLSNRFIFQNYIFPIYAMEERTFYNYLAINAKLELKKIKEQEDLQPKLNFIWE
jgi:hypothetical protein